MITIIISAITSIVVAIITLLGVIYQSNKTFNKQQSQFEASNNVFRQEFKDYKEFLHQINKDLQNDIKTLSTRVDQHNNFGIQIPVLEEKIKRLDARMIKVENNINKLQEL